MARGPCTRSPIADPLPVTVARWHLRLFSFREVIRQRRRDGLWTYLRTAPSPLEWDAARGTSSTVVSRPTCRPHTRSPNLPSHRKTERISRRTRTVSDSTLISFPVYRRSIISVFPASEIPSPKIRIIICSRAFKKKIKLIWHRLAADDVRCPSSRRLYERSGPSAAIGTDRQRCARPRRASSTMRAAALTAVAVLACCRPPMPAVRAACLHTARDLQAQARASEVVVKALAMRVWPEPDGLVGGHFAVMAVYKGARAVKNVLRVGGTDLFNMHDKWAFFLYNIFY